VLVACVSSALVSELVSSEVGVSGIDVSEVGVSGIDVSEVDVSEVDVSGIDVSEVDVSEVDVVSIALSSSVSGTALDMAKVVLAGTVLFVLFVPFEEYLFWK
jgi:hypothetical protein